MRKHCTAFLLCLCLLVAPAQAVTITLDGAPVNMENVRVYQDTTYVPLRDMICLFFPGAAVFWESGRAVAQGDELSLTAVPGEDYLTCNGRAAALPAPVRLENGRTLVPVRPLAQLFGLRVNWSSRNNVVELSRSAGPSYSEDDLYWLSRIISAESRGESWEGKIAVGNVVLNRVASPEFPNTIYGVIFDDRWGGQFEPVRNGTVYQEPTQESVQAALACLNGENTVGDSLYFLAPDLTSNHWTMENRDYVTTIGAHWFYR